MLIRNAKWLAVPLIVGWLSSAFAQVPVYLTRDAAYNRSGDEVFLDPMPQTWGGVVMQATVGVLDSEGKPISPQNLSLGLKLENGRDGFCLTYAATCHWTEMDRQSLVAITRWIGSKGTGAFSAFQLSKEVMKAAALTEATPRQIVPIEFRDTPLVKILYEIDFTGLLDTTADTSAVLHRRQQLAAQFGIGGFGSYFISDNDSAFTAQLKDNQITYAGVPLKYEWKPTTGPYVKVTSVIPLLDGPTSARLKGRELEEEINEITNEIKGSTNVREKVELQKELEQLKAFKVSSEYREEVDRAVQRAARDIGLYRTVAFLRTIYLANQNAWTSFMNEIGQSYKEELDRRTRIEPAFYVQ